MFSSAILSMLILMHAFYTKRFFYRTVIYLSNSKFAILAAANMVLVSVLLIWRLIQVIFLGPLRFRELERLHLRARDAIIEYCFAISVFRGDFNYAFASIIITVLLLKSLHWLAKDRTDFLEEQPLSPAITHVRLVGLLALLLFLDGFMTAFCIRGILDTPGRSMFVLFSFESTLLLIELTANIFQYVFLVIDQNLEGRWDSKGLYTFYAELFCDMSTLTLYILFFIYVQIHYSFPYHIIRELCMTLNKFRRRCSDFVRYRRVVATMNELFEDATEEELQHGDRTCIICREEMESAKKLVCGHFFHGRCLQSWLKRQLSCPTCRATIDVNSNTPRSQNLNGNPDGINNQQPANQRGQVPQQRPQQRRPLPHRAQHRRQLPHQQQPLQQPQLRLQPVAQQAPANANIGEAGAGLINFANQWLHQIMNDGLRQQPANPLPPNPANQRIQNQNNAQGNPLHPHPPHQQIQEHFNQQHVAANLQPHMPPQPQNPAHLPYFQQQFLLRPNAIAHMQLRARRRGLLPGIHQPYQPVYQIQHAHPNNVPANVQQEQGRNQASTSRSEGTTRASSGQPGSVQEQGSGRTAGSSSMHRSGAASSSGSTSAMTSNNGQSASTSTSIGPAPAASIRAAELEPRPSNNLGAPGAVTDIGLDAGRVTGITSRSNVSQALPLERLFDIQRQIEVLRAQVQDLVLHITEAQLSTMEPNDPSMSGTNATASASEHVSKQASERSEPEPRATSANAQTSADALEPIVPDAVENPAPISTVETDNVSKLSNRTQNRDEVENEKQGHRNEDKKNEDENCDESEGGNDSGNTHGNNTGNVDGNRDGNRNGNGEEEENSKAANTLHRSTPFVG